MPLRNLLLVSLVVILVSRAYGQELLMCGSAQVIEARVVDGPGGAPTLQETWHWRPEQSTNMPEKMMRKFITTDDCKAVSGGKEVLITSSGDAVALVSRETGATLFFAEVKNAHSAELLPGGFIVVAASSGDAKKGGNSLVLYDRNRSDKPIGYLPLEAAHGAVWDAQRKVLWAVGQDDLVRLQLDITGVGAHLEVEKDVKLPEQEGHELQLAADGSVLYVSTAKAVYSVDPVTLHFSPYAPFKGVGRIKSLSVNAATHQIAYTQADPGVWWTYTLRFLNPDKQITLPAFIYKVRWF